MNGNDLILKETESEMAYLAALLENSGELIMFALDLQGKYLFLNRRYQQLVFENGGVEIKTGDDYLEHFQDERKRQEANKLLKLILKGETISQAMACEPKNDKPATDWSNRWRPIRNENNEIYGVLCIGIDETEKNAARKKLFEEREKFKVSEMLGYHDQMTGLYNRRFLEDQMERIDQEKNLPISILMADINGLELINDSFGREIGGECIMKTADILVKNCAKEDYVVRYGNDEFVILLPETDRETVKALIKRIQDVLNSEKIRDTIEISVSFGYDTKEKVDENINNTLKNAEDLMYREKLKMGTSMKSETIKRVLEMLFNHNEGEKEHSIEVGEVSGKIAGLISDDQAFINQTIRAGELHDIGKITVDEKSLNKLKTLENSDWTDIRRHPERGYRLLSLVDEYKELAQIVYEHQERWDGKGYPNGLKGEEIMLQARIVAIAEAYEAMKHKLASKEQVLEELKSCAGSQFDPSLIKAFLTVLE
ncbi:diguanylate cyclase [Eubacteriaceae bacterium ES3]|nr:diguanylate cyclase [Eubacteriaceae bacterium ES3]